MFASQDGFGNVIIATWRGKYGVQLLDSPLEIKPKYISTY